MKPSGERRPGPTAGIAPRLRGWLLRQPPLSAAVARRFARLDVQLLRWTGGSLGGLMTGLSMLVLTTTGRRTGRPRSTPLAYAMDGRDWIVVVGNRGADRAPLWLESLRANPVKRVEVGRASFAVEASIVEGCEREEMWAGRRSAQAGLPGGREREGARVCSSGRLLARPGAKGLAGDTGGPGRVGDFG